MPGETTDVAVTLRPWSIGLDTDTIPAGTVNFSVSNEGPNYTHEFVIVKTDLAPGDLPTNGDGTVNEDSAELTKIDEVEVPVGETTPLNVDLDAGHYVAFCNLTVPDDGSAVAGKAHYMLGMRTEFTVQ